VRLTVVTAETSPGRWTAVAEGHEDAPGTGPTEEAAIADLRMTVVASRRWAGSGFAPA
jgi:hypothetical protein